MAMLARTEAVLCSNRLSHVQTSTLSRTLSGHGKRITPHFYQKRLAMTVSTVIENRFPPLPTRCAQTLTQHFHAISGLAMHPNGKLLSGSVDGTILTKVLGTNDKPTIFKQGGDGRRVSCLSVIGSNWLVAAGYDNGSIQVWSPSGGNTKFGNHAERIFAILGMYNRFWKQAMVISASFDHKIKVWDPTKSDPYAYEFPHVHLGPIYSLIQGNGQLVISGCEDHKIRFWEPSQARYLQSVDTSYPVSALALLPGGQSLVSGSMDSVTIKVWNISDLRGQIPLLNNFDAPSTAGGVASMATFPDGTIATGHTSGDINLWDPLNRVIPFKYRLPKKHQGQINVLKVLPDGSLVSGGKDKTISWWKS